MERAKEAWRTVGEEEGRRWRALVPKGQVRRGGHGLLEVRLSTDWEIARALTGDRATCLKLARDVMSHVNTHGHVIVGNDRRTTSAASAQGASISRVKLFSYRRRMWFGWSMTTNTTVCTTYAVLTLGLLCCMLIARFAGKGLQRLSALIPPSRTPPPTHYIHYTPHAQSQLGRPAPHSTTAVMLRGAVQKHQEEEFTRAKPRDLQNLFSSSPPIPPSQPKSASQSVQPGYRNPLMPATASAVNGVKNGQQGRGVVAGVKRNSSGLAKALGGTSTFEDGTGSQQRPIVLGDSTTVRGQAQMSFDENEFDSDIDLDVEEPLAKRPISYPKLAQQTAVTSPPPKAIVYPTLPRQQQAQPGLPRHTTLPGSGYDAVDILPNASA
ncbi:hypothetical protein LTR48_004585 [Friedmanniomyces endolithicus]|nr:hypothetical protein LTR48_004585 [Friedmanniomyces endolithicus]